MTTQHWHSVASGKPYPVRGVAAGTGSSLDTFLGDAEFSIDTGGEPLLIRGHGVLHGELVRFHEKDAVGGKDVRVWHVRGRDGAFVAESIAAF
jgi:hypothetical protein